jgi:hypothetical protein
MDVYPCAPAEMFIIAAFVGVLETAPAAHVINEHRLEVRTSSLDIGDELLEGRAPVCSVASDWFSVEYL